MSEKKELNQEQLEKVNGGVGTTDSHYSGFSGFVDMYAVEGYASETFDKPELYFVGNTSKAGVYWFKGKVFRSYEHSVIFERVHDVLVTEMSDNVNNGGGRREDIIIGRTCEIYGDSWCAYKNKTN